MFDSTDRLTRTGLRKSKFDRKWLCALFSQSLEDLQIMSCVRRDTLRSAIWTNSSSGVVLQRSLRWKPKPLVSTWAEKKRAQWFRKIHEIWKHMCATCCERREEERKISSVSDLNWGKCYCDNLVAEVTDFHYMPTLNLKKKYYTINVWNIQKKIFWEDPVNFYFLSRSIKNSNIYFCLQ